MPTGATVEEQVIDDVVAALAAIATPSYNFTIRKVQRQDMNALRVATFPCAIVVHLGTQQDDGRLGLIENVLRLGVLGCIRTERGSAWPEDLSLLASDIANKLREDWTRGGVAMDTHVNSTEVFDQEEMGGVGVAAAQLSVEVVFRHLYADTTTAI